MRIIGVTVLTAVLTGAGLLTACGGSSGSASPTTVATAPTDPGPVEIDVADLAGLGPVLVNSHGATLYMFVPDNRTHVSCTGNCATVWPPVALAAGGQPRAGAGIQASLIGSDRAPNGATVVTYNGWPLYTYSTDPGPHYAFGQGINNNGGKWFVMSPDGTPNMKPRPAPAPAA